MGSPTPPEPCARVSGASLFVVGTLLCLLFLLGIVYDDRRTDARRDNGSFGADLILFQTARADMGPKVDPRSQIQKARIGWVASWMGEQDEQGDRVGDWALQCSAGGLQCRWPAVQCSAGGLGPRRWGSVQCSAVPVQRSATTSGLGPGPLCVGAQCSAVQSSAVLAYRSTMWI